jgi:sodium/bile acid cotransporter 7
MDAINQFYFSNRKSTIATSVFRSHYETFRILDPFTLTLSPLSCWPPLFPGSRRLLSFFEGLTTAAIALLFFMHGAKLSREAIIAGGSHWRLHL